jgi:carbonic anhydrase
VPFLSQIIEPKSQHIESRNVFTVKDLIKHKRFDILTYKGSLTTPGCFETVRWLVSTTPLSISPADLAAFRKLKNESGKQLMKNFRPLKLSNRRSVVEMRMTKYGVDKN